MRLIGLKSRMREMGLKNIELSRNLGVSEKTVSEWINGKCFPKDNALEYMLSKIGSLKARVNSGKIISIRFYPDEESAEKERH